MTLRSLLLLTASLTSLALAQDESMCVVRTTIIPVVVTTTIGGPPPSTTTMSGTGTSGAPTVTVTPIPSGAYPLTDNNGKTYVAQNNTGASGNEIGFITKSKRGGFDIMSCIDACSTYSNPSCMAAMLDNSTNCHYFSSVSSDYPETGFIFAYAQGAVIGGGGNGGGSSGGSSSVMGGSSGTPAPPSTSMTPTPGPSTGTGKGTSTIAVSPSTSKPTITMAPSTISSTVSIATTEGVVSYSNSVVATVGVLGPPQVVTVNTFSTVTQTSTQFAGTITAVQSTTVTSVSTQYTATSVVTVNGPAPTNAMFALFNKAAVGDANVLTITVTAEPTSHGWLW